MKIAIPSDDRETIARHFGQVAGFEVITVEDDSITSREYRENQFSGHSDGRHADKHASILDTISDCDVVISNGMGHPMFAHLQKVNKEVIATDSSNIYEAVDAYLQGELSHDSELIHQHRNHHQH